MLELFSGSVKGFNDRWFKFDVNSGCVRLNLFFFSGSNDYTGDTFLVERPGVGDISEGVTSVFSDLLAVSDSFPEKILVAFLSMSALRAGLAVEMAGSTSVFRNLRGLGPSSSEEALHERGVADHLDVVGFAQRNDLEFNSTSAERVGQLINSDFNAVSQSFFELGRAEV